jgi:hypothetical protein
MSLLGVPLPQCPDLRFLRHRRGLGTRGGLPRRQFNRSFCRLIRSDSLSFPRLCAARLECAAGTRCGFFPHLQLDAIVGRNSTPAASRAC